MKIDHIYIITINNTSENYSDTLNRITSMGLPNKCTYEFRGVNGYLLSNDDLSSRNISVYSKWNLDDVFAKLIIPFKNIHKGGHYARWYNPSTKVMETKKFKSIFIPLSDLQNFDKSFPKLASLDEIMEF